ncbi:1,4-beta-xylanase [Pedobacter sp. HMF7647]|uniref:Beta-xylanase n=1 Tax=Hufsiella arboris TaxID=2695275 RepID=A0A7K1YBN7_9SPHI|nr:endo-1,4-beta-xylanase [Hufsiella arboris]MXV51840.1 1,4-beta-xylanase [Hufsiella arboris]
MENRTQPGAIKSKVRGFFGAISISISIIWVSSAQEKQNNSISLKQAYHADFLIGTALNAAQIEEKDSRAEQLISQQFNAITSENILKAVIVHPQWDRYNFTLGDKYVDYGERHHMFIVGHTLIWHRQLPGFVHRIRTKDSLNLFMKTHINAVAGRYKGRINGWDVLNEALNEDGTYRNSVFYRILGFDYIPYAFKLAELAAPGAELYYNDYNIEQPAKRAGAITLIKKIQETGARIDGVGIQGHWHVGKVPFKDIEESILQFAALGIKVMVTELDIEVLPRNSSEADVNQRMRSTPDTNPYTKRLPDSVQQQLASDYENLFKLFLKHRDKLSRVTFWGVNDGQSWLNNWPIMGRTNYPLIFDRQYKPKPAYDKIMSLKAQTN